MDDLWQPIRFDREMIVKYDRPGPRYTSYPTAPQFTDDFGPLQYREVLARSGEKADRPLSLYVHVPFCDVRCFFCGCNVTISRDRTWGRRYLPMLAREVEMAAALLQAGRREVVQVHWGGRHADLPAGRRPARADGDPPPLLPVCPGLRDR